ncbi:MAG: patatin-like phospholipase RssA [Nitrosospira multiformis]|nr:patatin-like phospholipase RssA [Nitrosospira multiformis]
MSGIRTPRVGLVLGSGSARGWAHIGVIRALEQTGVRPDLVCGTSIGSLVGAAYAAGELDRFEQWVLGLGLREVIAYMDIDLNSGLFKGERLVSFFRSQFTDRPVEDLHMPFAAVATSLHTGAEVWLREGSVVDAVRASIALPGLFSPVLCKGSVLVDGGLVNPVPVSLARAMGSDIVIAVDLSSDVLGRHLRVEPPPDAAAGDVSDWIHKLQDSLGAFIPAHSPETPKMPSMLDVLASSINIMQVRINRSRMAGEPPDVIIAPRLAHLGLLDFHRAKEAIEEGKQAVERVAHNLSAFNNQILPQS